MYFRGFLLRAINVRCVRPAIIAFTRNSRTNVLISTHARIHANVLDVLLKSLYEMSQSIAQCCYTR